MTPTVGIPQSLDEQGRWKSGRTYHYLDAAYAAAVDRAGGAPLYLPPSSDPRAQLACIDALLIPGGDDFAPPRPYPDHVRFELVPDAQLAFDRALLEAALERDIPVLGICYGMQLLALRLGAALHYDLASDASGAGEHRLGDGRHRVKLEPRSQLAQLTGKTELSVSSRHHQAVSDPGPRLQVSARADDGVIEAIETPRGFCVGVQWHPEGQGDADSEALFRAFVEAAKRGQTRETMRAPRSAARIPK